MLDGFAAVLKDGPKERVQVRGGRYGKDPRQEYDLFLPAGPERDRPAVLFVHGGALTEGHRNRNDELYANVLYFLGSTFDGSQRRALIRSRQRWMCCGSTTVSVVPSGLWRTTQSPRASSAMSMI
jgi:hypothetical protein